MRKLFTFLLAATFVAFGSSSFLNAQDIREHNYVNENFDGIETMPQDWSINNGIYGYSFNTPTFGDDLLTISRGSSGSEAGTRGGTISFPSPISAIEEYPEYNITKSSIEFDFLLSAATITARNIFHFTFLSPQDSTLLSLYLVSNDGMFYVWNKDVYGTGEGSNGSPVIEGTTFRRAATANDAYDEANALNASTLVGEGSDLRFDRIRWFRVLAEFDYVNNKVTSLTITDRDNAEVQQVIVTDMPFVSLAAADEGLGGVAKLAMVNTRSSSTGNAATLNYTVSLDNFRAFINVPSTGKGDVVVTFKDTEENIIKTVTHADQEDGLIYRSPASDKVTFIQDGIYYAYDALLSTPDITVVKDQNNDVTLVFKSSPSVVDQEFIWAGSTDNTWDQLTENFTLNGVVASYQQGNGVTFSDENSANKEVNIIENLDMGVSEVKITAPGYTLYGSGRLEGTDALTIEKGATINVENRLLEGIMFTGDTLRIGHAAAATQITAENGSVLDMKAAYNNPIIGNAGELIIMQTANITNASRITNVSQLNYVLTKRGGWSSYNYSSTTNRLNNEFDGPVKVTTTAGDSTLFSMTVDSPATSFDLGEGVCLVYGQNPASGVVGSALEIGAVSGSAGSWIAGHRLGGRILTYNIGGLNTDATFAGKLHVWDDQTTLDEVTGETIVTQIANNINKVGTGTWTLTGESTDYYGAFNVNGGTLELGGRLGLADKVTLTVDDGATLKGIGGYLGAEELIIRGTYSGSLTIDSEQDVTFIDATARMDVKSFHDGNFDQMIVSGMGALVLTGSTLEITVEQIPSYGDAKIQLFVADQGGFLDTFASVTVNGVQPVIDGPGEPGDFVWYSETMELEYIVDGLGIGSESAVKEVANEKYYDLTGKELPADAKGFVIKKTTYVDGSVSNEKVVIK